MTEFLCQSPSCSKPAKHTVGGRALCGNHRRHAEDMAARIAIDATELMESYVARYLPDMRQQDSGMLQRIVAKPDEVDERLEMRLMMAARKAAAEIILQERMLNGAHVVA
jgi:hypothetical protein